MPAQVDGGGADQWDMDGPAIDLSTLYRAAVTVCARGGSGRYQTTLVALDRLVLDPIDIESAAPARVGELISVGCAHVNGWVTGEVRVLAQNGSYGLVTTAPELTIAQRREVHRVAVTLPLVIDVPEGDLVVQVVGETIDVSATGFAAQVAPATILEGEGLRARLTLPGGHVVEGAVDVIVGGSVVRAHWSKVGERSRDRIVGVINQVQARRVI